MQMVRYSSGQAIDRLGQARVLVIAAMMNSASLALLISSVQLDWPTAVTLLAALGVGAGFSSAGSAVRARWSHRLAWAAHRLGMPALYTGWARTSLKLYGALTWSHGRLGTLFDRLFGKPAPR